MFAEIKMTQFAPNAEIAAAEIMVWGPSSPGRTPRPLFCTRFLIIPVGPVG